jgi:MFS family permease
LVNGRLADLAAAIGEAWRPFLVCLAGVALSTADQSLFSYAVPAITAEFSVGLAVIGQMLSASFLVASVTVVFAGIASDRYGRKRVFTLLLMLSALMVAAQGFAKDLTDLTVYRVLGFALGAGLYPIANTIVIEAAAARFRGLIAGLLQMGYPLGFAFAALVATPLLRDYGWRAIFMFGLVIAVLAPLLGRALPESGRFEAVRSARTARTGSFADGLRVIFSPPYRRRSVICFAGSFLISLAIGGTTYFLPIYLVEAHGVDADEAARIAGSSFAIGAVGYLLASVTGEFITTRRNTLVIWALLGAVFFGLTLWLPGMPLVLGLGLSIVFFYGSEAVRVPMIAEMYPTEIRGTASAAIGSLAVTTAWLVSPLLISYLAPTIGWALGFSWCALLPLVLSAGVFLALENRRSDDPMEEGEALRG